MTNTTAAETATKKHVFETAGLGKGPFRCVGFEVKKFQAVPGDPNCPVQPGSSCDYCGTGIMNVFWVVGSDGRRFKVGCDCVLKTGDAGLRRTVDEHLKKAQGARDAARIEAAEKLLQEEKVITAFRAAPHPVSCMAVRGLSLMDYATWMFTHAGTSGKIKIARLIEGVYFDKPARKPAAQKAAPAPTASASL